jgi:protoporphyrin/coproporphyrin ferrochelatase
MLLSSLFAIQMVSAGDAMSKTAVLLLQMGGPDSIADIEPFLYNLFSDRDIMKIGPAFLQPMLAKFIARRRSRKVAGYYSQIGGRSPIRELTGQQAVALEKQLGNDYRCFVAMRYSRPDTDSALSAIAAEGLRRIIVLPLYPHYSRATTGSSINELKRILAGSAVGFEVSYVTQYSDHPLYIDALAEKIDKGLACTGDRGLVQLLFSAHGLPQSFIDSGDPYLEQIETTVRLVMKRFEGVSHHLCFQSRAGPVKWLEPSTEDKLRELAESHAGAVLVVPVSFVSDHIETLYEIDIQYRNEAFQLGLTDFNRVESLNSSPLFVSCLADLVLTVEKAEKVVPGQSNR